MAKLSKYTKQRLSGYFKQKLGAFTYRKGWMKSKCPFCGKEGKYGININLNRTNCFRCGEHPSPVSLVMELEDLKTYADFQDFIDKSEYVAYDFKDEVIELHDSVTVDMPEGFRLFGHDDGSMVSKVAHSYIVKNRGFDIRTIRSLGWGFCVSGDLFGYLVIPFFEQARMVYYNARRIIGNGPRYKNPVTEDSGVGKSFLIYNREALYLFDKVYLCEGAINATTLGEQGISSSGKAVSRYQINTILKSQVSKVVIILDSDAKLKAIDVALKLCHDKRVKVVFLPEGKDVNDLGKAITMRYIREAEYVTYQDLITIKQRVISDESTIYTYN